MGGRKGVAAGLRSGGGAARSLPLYIPLRRRLLWTHERGWRRLVLKVLFWRRSSNLLRRRSGVVAVAARTPLQRPWNKLLEGRRNQKRCTALFARPLCEERTTKEEPAEGTAPGGLAYPSRDNIPVGTSLAGLGNPQGDNIPIGTAPRGLANCSGTTFQWVLPLGAWPTPRATTFQ